MQDKGSRNRESHSGQLISKWLAFAMIAVSPSIAAYADPMYISDKLVVNVYAEANQESGKVATLDSGDAVEAIEKAEGYTHIKLADNREGWVKSSYLSAQVPAIVRLKELEKERSGSTPAPSAQLSEEIKQLKEHNAALQTEVSTLRQAASQPSTAPTAAIATPAPQGRLEGEQSLRDTDSPSLLQHLGYGGALLVAGAVLGFTLGYQTLARRIRRKYGSVKIY